MNNNAIQSRNTVIIEGFIQRINTVYNKVSEIIELGIARKEHPGVFKSKFVTRLKRGDSSLKAGDFVAAIKDYSTALSLASKSELALCHKKLGETSFHLEKINQAIEHCEKSLALSLRKNSKEDECSSRIILALSYVKSGHLDLAIEHLRAALSYYKELRLNSIVAALLEILGSLFLHLKEFSEAKIHTQDAIILFEKSGDFKMLAICNQSMKKIEKGEISMFEDEATDKELEAIAKGIDANVADINRYVSNEELEAIAMNSTSEERYSENSHQSAFGRRVHFETFDNSEFEPSWDDLDDGIWR